MWWLIFFSILLLIIINWTKAFKKTQAVYAYEQTQKEREPKKFLDSVELNQEQEMVKKLVLDGESIFLTGGAGTGKSFLLKHVINLLQEKHGREKVGITFTTGTGALIIGGQTFHSYLGVGIVGHLETEVLLKKISANKKFEKVERMFKY